MTPYLQLLLNRKKNDPSIWSERLPDGSSSLDMSDRGGSPTTGPTIPLRSIPRYRESDQPTESNAPLVMSLPTGNGSYGERVMDRTTGRITGLGTPRDYAPLAQQPAPTIPLGPRPTMNRDYQPFTPTAAPVDPWMTRIEADRQRIIDAQNKPHSKLKAIGEGLADWAASGVGIPLRRIMHPHGTETEQAQRQLGTDLALQKQGLDVQDQQSTIALRSKQIAKIDNELNNPDTSDEDKADLEAIKEGIKVFEGQASTTENDAAYAQLKARAAKRNIILPSTYGPRAKAAMEKVPTRGSVVEKGVKYQTEYDPETKKWVKSIGSDGQPIVEEEAKPEIVTPEPPNTTTNWATLEAGFRKNATTALAVAQKAEQDAKDYIASQSAAKGSGFDPAKDANVAALTAESRRQRQFAEEQTKQADTAAFKKTEAAASDAKAGAKIRKVSRGTPAPTTHAFSVSAWMKANPGKTKADAQSFHDSSPKYKSYDVVP